MPAGILQGLYFNELFHPAVNFGGTGATQGHEMTHGFDDQGAQFDGSENRVLGVAVACFICMFINRVQHGQV